ncbi:MAG: peptidoglycan-binding protein, partial [Desulfobacteraceae bacterium]|nr:peptidoglycan-binding protein [Desulfobacteraceae bacterium]
MSDFTLDKNYKKESKGNKVKLIQEWLSLNGFGVCIDDDFGSATDYAVREFQRRNHLRKDGIVGKNTFSKLIFPITNALKRISPDEMSLGEIAVAYAEQNLKENPREMGGQNNGPWVRLYMKGKEGPEWAWCAGFACFILRQACLSLGVRLPLKTSISCDTLAANAKGNGIFLKESKFRDKSQVTPGSFFLSRRTSTDWVHTGIVVRADDEVFETIEGNTNDEGSR